MDQGLFMSIDQAIPSRFYYGIHYETPSTSHMSHQVG
jgi:hypothetical protein